MQTSMAADNNHIS